MKRYKRLEETDRVSIQVLTKRGHSDAEITRELGVHRSSAGRMRRRNTVAGKTIKIWRKREQRGAPVERLIFRALMSALTSFTLLASYMHCNTVIYQVFACKASGQ